MHPDAGPSSAPSPRLKDFLRRWAFTTLAVLIAEWVVPGIRCGAWPSLLAATLILGALNAVLRPLLIASSVGLMAALNLMLGVKLAILTLPAQILLFGFLVLAINAALLLAVASLVPAFSVAGFWAAFWGGAIISVITVLLNFLTSGTSARITFRRGATRRPGPSNPQRPHDRRDVPPPRGPIIDV